MRLLCVLIEEDKAVGTPSPPAINKAMMYKGRRTFQISAKGSVVVRDCTDDGRCLTIENTGTKVRDMMFIIIYNLKVFQFDFSTGLGEHDCKIFKKRFRLDVRKFSCSNRVSDNWNCLSAPCVNSGTINTCRKHVSVQLEPETVN